MELFWALLYFAAAVTVHALASRLPRGNSITKFLLVGCVAGLALGCHLLLLSGPSLAAAASLLAYAFACELYLFLFTLVASSVSVRLLLLLRERNLSRPQIQALYEPTGMVARRIDRLILAGLLERAGQNYRVSARGRRLVRVFMAFRRFFRHPDESITRKAA